MSRVIARASGVDARVGRRAFVVASPVAVTLVGRRAEARTSLEAATARGDFPKQVFASTRARVIAYPTWLEGEWIERVDFGGATFPDARFDFARLSRAAETPGFRKLSVARTPDVGRERTTEHRVRFTRVEGRGVVEDREFNMREVMEAYLGPDAVESVTTDGDDRMTIRLTRGASPNAERIELFTNARESETAKDGTFYASESVRQVALGYGTEYGTARMSPTDYEHVWTFTPQPDIGASAVDFRAVNRVAVKMITAAYLQPNDALRLTASATANPRGAPVPQVLDAGSLAFEPVVLYTHVALLERVGCVP